MPPFDPAQDQAKGPEPLTVEALPMLHRLVVGAPVTATPLAEPQVPLMAVCFSGAEQLALVPPLEPRQLQAQGPEPVMDEVVPVLQRLVVGAVLTATLLAGPHWPLTGGGGGVVPALNTISTQ